MPPDPMNSPHAARVVAQPILAPLSRSAIFLVATLKPGADHRAMLRSFCGDLGGLFRAVDFRNIEAGLSCVMGIGSDAWDRLFGAPRPAKLHPFREILAGPRHAVAAADEVHGFRYFDERDLVGFVDGTENPRGDAISDAALVGDEDPAFAAGSYVIVQKYLHDLAAWNALPTEAQERIIGRRKLSDIELDDSVKPTSAHSALTTIVEDGREIKILRDNMPFGRAAQGEFGTYFIGYSRSPSTIEQMLENMFIGRPPGNFDRLLDFSRAVTGNLFFVPTATFLENVAGD